MADLDPFDDADAPLVLKPGADAAGARLDKALADAAAAAAPDLALSRSRIAALIAGGHVRRLGEAASDGGAVLDASAKVKPDDAFALTLPPPEPIAPEAEAIPLDIRHEDAALIVLMKPAGLAVHPAPGTPRGTLVNALLAHAGDALPSVGGALRPGVVHRLDKDTSGLLVVAKTDRAHQALSAQFAARSVERRYLALVWGAPDRGDPRLAGLPSVSFEGAAGRIEAAIGRSRSDRKKMAVIRGASGKPAVTRFETLERFGAPARAGLIACRLETGRTHQIRVHLSHVGHPLLGDPVYGAGRAAAAAALPDAAQTALRGLAGQALHAETLGFTHPESGERLRFSAPPPPAFTALAAALRAL